MRAAADRRAIVAVILVSTLAACSGSPDGVTGIVVDEAGAGIAGATVRVQATAVATTTDVDGAFRLVSKQPVHLAASAPGFYIGGGDEVAPGEDVIITLHAVPTGDNPDYDWMQATAGEDQAADVQTCADCHRAVDSGGVGSLPVDQWLLDAHGNSAANPRFLTMYAGTDVHGNRSPDTRYVSSRDYGPTPLAPDPALPNFGPGYRLDFPATNGNCASCHVPMADADDPYGVDVRTVAGVAAEGISCDFCHKVRDVRIDATTGLPDPGRPGVLSIDLLRPPEGQQFFAGPFDDVAPGEDAFSPLHRESRFCAPCHFGVFWDTVVYDSYGEWLRSPYADPDTGMTCQDCHMPATGERFFALPDQGGRERLPDTLHTHLMPGAADEDLLRRALDLDVVARRVAGDVRVSVEVTNVFGGHHVPTDSPLRHVMLIVDATGPDGSALPLVSGPTLPGWCGADGGERSYGGRPGFVYAKVLEEVWTGVSPTGAYWSQTTVVADSRIPALASHTSAYVFDAPEGGAVTVRLVYRRAPIDLIDQKGWDAPDVEMVRTTFEMPASATR